MYTTINSDDIQKLEKLRPDADKFAAKLEKFKKNLASCKTKDEFYAVVKQMIVTSKEIPAILNATVNMKYDKVEMSKYIQKNPHLTSVGIMLDYRDVISNEIIHTKEKISLKDLIESLPEHKQESANKFINNVKNLMPIVEVINVEKERIKHRLNNLTSPNDVDDIEADVEAKDREFNRILTDNIAYPKDEETAGALIKYLDINPHILGLLKAFNFHENLTDDILDARAENLNSLHR